MSEPASAIGVALDRSHGFGRLLRTLLVLAWPVVISRASQAVIGFSDTLMVAPLGEEALLAVTMGAIDVLAVVLLPLGTVFILQSYAAQFAGAGDFVSARRYAWYGLGFSGVAGVVGWVAIPWVEPAIGLLGYEPRPRALMTSYLELRLWGVAAAVGTEALGNWFSGLGHPTVHMRAALVSMCLNVGLNYLLIEGHFGAPALGVDGAAIASVLATFAGFGYVAFAFRRSTIGIDAAQATGLSWREFSRMLRFGLPNGANWFLEFAAFAYFLNVVVGGLGTVPTAAMMVVFNVNSVSFMPAFGIASAGAILTGQAIGAERKHEVRRIVLATLTLAAIWQGTVGLVYLAWPRPIMGLFASPTTEANAFVEIGTTMLLVSVAWQLFDAVGMTFSETLRSAGDTAFSAMARLVCSWCLFVPGSHFVVAHSGGSPVAAQWTVVGYLALLAIVLALRFKQGAWRSIQLRSHSMPVDG